MATQIPDDDPDIRELERMEAEEEARGLAALGASGVSNAVPEHFVTLAIQLSEIVLGTHMPPEITRKLMRKVIQRLAGTGLRSGKGRKGFESLVVSNRLDDTIIVRDAVSEIIKELHEASSEPVVGMVLVQKEPEEETIQQTVKFAMSLANRLGFFDVAWQAHCQKRAMKILEQMGVDTFPRSALREFVAELQDGTRKLNVSPATLRQIGLTPNGASSGNSAVESGCATMVATIVCVFTITLAAVWMSST